MVVEKSSLKVRENQNAYQETTLIFKKQLSEDISTTTWPNSIKIFLFEFYGFIEFK